MAVEEEEREEESSVPEGEDEISKLKFKVLICFILCGLLTVLSISAITLAIIKTTGIDAQIAESKLGIDRLVEKKSNELDASFKKFTAISKSQEGQMKELSAMLNNLNLDSKTGVLRSVQIILINREKSYQKMLKSVRNGIYSLALMVPGSRVWYSENEEKILEALDESKLREKQLTRLSKKTTTRKPKRTSDDN